MITTIVYGPAYLDRVVHVDRPLAPGRRLDGSMDGMLTLGESSAHIEDRAGGVLSLRGLDLVGRPLGGVRVDGTIGLEPHHERTVDVVSDRDDLGGMGAGFASAFGGILVSALGPIGEPIGSRVAAMLTSQGIEHRPVRVPATTSDWSLIVSSGPFGDKLAIGFRGCHAGMPRFDATGEASCRLLIAAAIPNRLIADALGRPAAIRFVAPAMRNAVDRETPLSSLAGRFDVASLNRREWEAIPDRDAIRERTPVVVVTDGPDGCFVSYRDRENHLESLAIPAFPRANPPRDTNRAGEAFASSFLKVLLREGWQGGPASTELIRAAAVRGSAAAALVLDREDFGFASDAEIDAALASGIVGAAPLDVRGGPPLE